MLPHYRLKIVTMTAISLDGRTQTFYAKKVKGHLFSTWEQQYLLRNIFKGIGYRIADQYGNMFTCGKEYELIRLT